MASTIFRRLSRDQRGATAVEYGLIAVLVSIAALAAMGNLGSSVSTNFSEVNSSVSDAVH
ncbi:MAG: Flp family type IVb pilin [Alteraurantiacibacter sp.]